MAKTAKKSSKNVDIVSFKPVANVKYVPLIEQIAQDMMLKTHGLVSSSFMLAGEPGNGKTSFVKLFTKITGIPLMIVEIPHLVEENIINIPFVVFDKDKEYNSIIFDVEMASSHLYAELQKLKTEDDKSLISRITKDKSSYEYSLWKELGGDSKTIPQIIVNIRAHFNNILFLDEYYRKTSVRMRNILRDILNNKVGMHELGADTYVIYASNVSDVGDSLDQRLENEEFRMIKFETPNKDDWFSYIVSKHKNLDSKLVDVFYTFLEQEYLSYDDIKNDVRVSPRRWEQIMLYVNANLDNPDTAFITNLRTNFKNYITGNMCDFAGTFLENIGKHLPLGATSSELHSDKWRDILKNQIVTKQKLGDNRKYIPVVAGAPGIGKTYNKSELAKELGMILVSINCSTINADDTIGLPLSETIGNELVTKFSMPPLLKRIYAEINHKVNKLSEKEKKELESKEYKYLIFFDEFNRCNEKVQNSLRRPLLEGSFSDQYPLPEGSIVVAAINPKGNGISELTHHMRDVVDVIQATPNWEHTRKYFETIKMIGNYKESSKIALLIIDAFASRFQNKNELFVEQRKFNIDINGNNCYISPRAYTDMYSSMAYKVDCVLTKYATEYRRGEIEDVKLIINKVTEQLWSALEQTLDSAMNMYSIQAPEFKEDVKEWLHTSSDTDIQSFLYTKVAKVAELENILGSYLDFDDNKHLFNEIDLVSYVETKDATQISEEFGEMFFKLVTPLENVEKYCKGIYDKKKVVDPVTRSVTIVKLDEKAKLQSRINYMMDELLNAFVIHKVAYDKIEIIVQGLRTMTTNVLTHYQKTIDYQNSTPKLMALLETSTSFAQYHKQISEKIKKD